VIFEASLFLTGPGACRIAAVLWEKLNARIAGTGSAILITGSVLAAHVSGGVEYDAASLFTPAQPAFDISQNRPGLELRRPAVGSINNLGQLTGSGDAGGNQLAWDTRPFFYDHQQGTTANLGDLSGDFADQGDTQRNGASVGMDVNDAGWVVGVSSTTTGVGTADDRPFLWFDGDGNYSNSPGEMVELGLNPGATFGKALRVNNAGRVLVTGDSGLYRADVSLNGGVVTEPVGRTFISANAGVADMNDGGEVAYISGNAGYVWRDLNTDSIADANEVVQIPFMSVGQPNSTVFGINNAGQVVGTMRNDSLRDIGYIWTDLDGDNVVDWADGNGNGFFEAGETSSEVVRFHGDPGGIGASAGSTFVFDINDQGVAVGGYFDSSTRRAFVYDGVNGMRFLDDLIGVSFPLGLREADAINNAGQIAAVGRAPASSLDQLVLLTPLAAGVVGDLNADGFVGIGDLNIVLSNWNQNVPPGEASLGDPSDDGFVGIDDLNTVLGNWNAGTPPPPGAEASANIPEPSIVVTGLLLVLIGFGRPRVRMM
jgi:hypothetical protein